MPRRSKLYFRVGSGRGGARWPEKKNVLQAVDRHKTCDTESYGRAVIIGKK